MIEGKSTTIEGFRVGYLEGGSGTPLLMVHGVGPGTSIPGNFEPVLEPLTERYHVFAMDLIGFGASERKTDAPFFDVPLWLRQAEAILKLMPEGPVFAAGHSLGGALMLKLAASNRRVQAVLSSSGIGSPYRLTEALDAFWTLPSDRATLRSAMEAMVYDPAAVIDQMIEGRWKQLVEPGYGEYFAMMFAGDRQDCIDAAVITEDEFAALETNGTRVSLIHGRNDNPCPAEVTCIPIADRLRDADLLLIARCGHNLPREATSRYLANAYALFG